VLSLIFFWWPLKISLFLTFQPTSLLLQLTHHSFLPSYPSLRTHHTPILFSLSNPAISLRSAPALLPKPNSRSYNPHSLCPSRKTPLLLQQMPPRRPPQPRSQRLPLPRRMPSILATRYSTLVAQGDTLAREQCHHLLGALNFFFQKLAQDHGGQMCARTVLSYQSDSRMDTIPTKRRLWTLWRHPFSGTPPLSPRNEMAFVYSHPHLTPLFKSPHQRKFSVPKDMAHPPYDHVALFFFFSRLGPIPFLSSSIILTR